MAEDPRKLCAGTTTMGPTQVRVFVCLSTRLLRETNGMSVTPIVDYNYIADGRVQAPEPRTEPDGDGTEKQGKAVIKYLAGKGFAKEWVSLDLKDLNSFIFVWLWNFGAGKSRRKERDGFILFGSTVPVCCVVYLSEVGRGLGESGIHAVSHIWSSIV